MTTPKPATDYEVRDALKDPITDRNLRRRAVEVSDALKATRGTVSAPTPDEVYNTLVVGLRVLAQRPDIEMTTDLICLRRNPHDRTDFHILLNVGNIGLYGLPVTTP